MLNILSHPGVYQVEATTSYFCNINDIKGLPVGIPGKVLNMVMLYKGEVGKVIQVQISSKNSMTEAVVPEIQKIQNTNFSRVSLILGYREAIELFSQGDIVLLYRALKVLGLHTKTYIGLDFNNVMEDEAEKIFTLLLRLKQLGFMFYGNNDLGSDIIRSFEGNVPLQEDVERALKLIELKRDFLDALKEI